MRTVVLHMETKAAWSAKTTPTTFVAQRKQKGGGLGNTCSSSDLKTKSLWQCHLQPPLPPSMKPPYSRFSVLKVFLLVSLVALLFHNIISPLFSYPTLIHPLMSFSTLSFSSNLSPSSSSSSSSSSDLDSYSRPNLDTTSLSPPHLESSSSQSLPILNSPPPQLLPPPPLPLSSPPQVSSNLITSSSSNSFPPEINAPPLTPPPPTPPVDLISPPSPPPLQSSLKLTSPPLSPLPSPFFDLVSPKLQAPPQPSLKFVSPPTTLQPSSVSTSNSGHSKGRRKAKQCDLSQGEWIRDWQAPYYTNMTCYTIQEHQNCMKYGRPNLDFLKWRWKPDRCELPLFEPGQFLELMRGKSLAFIGDSLARNQMQSLMCLLSQVAYPEDISETSDDSFKKMYYPAFNFTISIFWSPFLIRAKETRGPGGITLWNFYLDEVDQTWASHIDKFNYVIISGGNWFNRPSIFYRKGRIVGCLYCPSKKVVHLTMHYSHQRAFHTAFKAINRSDKFKGTVILRSVSPHHFENGVWDKGGDCVRTRPFQRNETKLVGDDLNFYKVQISEFHRAKKEGRRRGIEYMLLDATNAMLLRPDGHPSRYGHWPDANVTLYNDCVHWCLPGPVDVWNDFLFQMLSF